MPLPDDEVFSRAIEFSHPEQQDRYIEEACAVDPGQKKRLLTLLGTHRRMEQRGGVSILERASEQLNSLTRETEPLPGAVIDRYRLVEKVGEGGMGIVFSAEQVRPIQRLVALKLLRPGMSSQRILARFALERQLLEQMDHPGITRVLDAGVQENGCPFFVMELVRNPVRMSDYCDQKKLSIADRIQLLIRVCRVVHYAHQRGVIHRDLKPSNILVSRDDERPQPRIIDFGIAKALNGQGSADDSTAHGDCLGTPGYMSPEQALSTGGSPDIRSDIYSLGVVLYELLTGETPRPHQQLTTGNLSWKTSDFWKSAIIAPSARIAKLGDSAAEIALKRGCTVDDLSRTLTHDLDSILQKSLAIERDERYQNVSELQRDLERFLAGHPVEAVGPSKLYRFRKLVLRHRWTSAATACALAAILTTSVLATVFALRATRAEQAASQRLTEVLAFQEELKQKKEEAETSSKQARAVLKILQAQQASMVAVTRFTEPLLQSIQNGAALAPELTALASVPLNPEVISTPDPRLIIRGDWTWATSSMELVAEAYNSCVAMSSGDAIVASGLVNHPNWDAAKGSASEFHYPAKLRYQKHLLEELEKNAPADDPFLAEVLDNCGLLAIRLGEHDAAVEFLSRSSEIWQQHKNYRPNFVQSQLFLAEAMIHQGRVSEARTILSKAESELQGSLSVTAEGTQLLSLLQNLSAQTSATDQATQSTVP